MSAQEINHTYFRQIWPNQDLNPGPFPVQVNHSATEADATIRWVTGRHPASPHRFSLGRILEGAGQIWTDRQKIDQLNTKTKVQVVVVVVVLLKYK